MCFEIVFILRLYFAEHPLREAHLQVLRNTQNRTDNVEQQAGWSNKSWTLVINEILSKLSCPEVLERLRLTRAPLHASDLKVCREDASVFFELCLETCAQRAWSMASLSETQPHSWLGLCDPDLESARECFAKIQRDAVLVTKAFHKMKEDKANCDAQASTVDFFLLVYLMTKDRY